MWLSKFCENFQTHPQDKQIDIMVVPHRLTSHPTLAEHAGTPLLKWVPE